MPRTVNSKNKPDGAPTQYKIGDAVIDTATRQLRFKGELSEVQPKVFDLLVYLIIHRDRAVSKDELLDQVWPSVVVSEASLTQTVKRARDLFRNQGFSEEVIRTVSRNGYQFEGPVEVLDSSPSIAVSQTRTSSLPRSVISVAIVIVVVGLIFTAWQFFSKNPDSQIGVSAPQKPSVAVLPFSNLTPDADFQYFADGLTETLTSSISRVRGLRVIANSSANAAQINTQDFSSIGAQLDVGYVVLGSVQKEGDSLRISTRLISTADGTQFWSHIFNRDLQEVFSLHDEISLALYEQLNLLVSGTLNWEKKPQALAQPAENSQAYLLTLRARELGRNTSKEGLVAAALLLREALDLAPNYPEAMVALADVIRRQATTGELPREAGFSEALILANRAAELSPDYAEAWMQIADIQYRHFWDFEQAGISFQRALEANPGSAAVNANYGRYLSRVGQFEESVRKARIAQNLDPLSTSAASSLVVRLIRADALDEARTALDIFTQHHPQHYDIPWLETNWHIRNGTYNNALQAIALEELDYLRLSLSAVAMFHLGRTEQARHTLEELIRIDAEGAAFQIAEVYAQWQDTESAFEWLERAFRQGDPGLSELYSSLNLENLYQDPRFTSLAKRVGLPPLE